MKSQCGPSAGLITSTITVALGATTITMELLLGRRYLKKEMKKITNAHTYRYSTS